jgi:hypothetical protein
LLTKINTIIIFSTSAATLSILVVTATGITTILAQQFNAHLAELYPHNVFNVKLAGSNEVPAVTTAASGTATFQLLPAAGHEQVLSFQLSLKNINGVTGSRAEQSFSISNTTTNFYFSLFLPFLNSK